MISSSLSTSFARALQAAQDAAGAQQHPTHTLYVVATPIGNLADISLRALHVLGLVDTLACEDTRHTRQMLQAYGLERPAQQLLAVHQHNETEAAQMVLERLAQGERVAYVSDAGTPAISDPGARLVRAVRAAGHRVLPLPGASSITTLLSAGGMTGDGFVFSGFLPSKAAERQQAVQAIAQEGRAVLLLEAPHRMAALAEALAVLGSREVTVGRELTKQFEQIVTLAARDLPVWMAERPEHQRGEFVLLVHEQPVMAAKAEGERILRCLLPELPLKTAVKLAAEISGEPRNGLYEQALALKAQGD
ncbi:MAG: 16S rRNA (cytidine(1402)-2'-O)-methyltransferase [Limnohabitans sp.]|jgi:16S rRNA (cytidine1402-2'-O)-methyltransferase